MALTARGERTGRTMLTDEFSRETGFSLFHWLVKGEEEESVKGTMAR